MNEKDFMVFLRALRDSNPPKVNYRYAWQNAKIRGS